MRKPAPLTLVPPIHRATHRIGLYLARLDPASSRAGGRALSQGEAHILAQLALGSPASLADLHRGLAHKRSTLTSILDRLVARGLITREVGASDRRTFIVKTTRAGRALARRVHQHLAQLERAVSAGLTDNELRTFLKVAAVLEREAHGRPGGHGRPAARAGRQRQRG